tara:strand:+ start:199 stop:804 length:606 start_codon:yes stop_codon:yes gene_type:complete
MTPSKLFKLNLKHYKYFLLTILISLIVGFYLSQNFTKRQINTYKIIIVEDINTKFLIDQVYKREGENFQTEDYYKYLNNYVVSEFLSSKFSQNSDLEIERTGLYKVVKTFTNDRNKNVESFEENLNKFLAKIQIDINKEITGNFRNSFGKQPIDIKANSKLFFKKNSETKGSNPFALYFVTIIIGIIIMNFIIILENPPKN